jgi:hypothetical protein
MEYDLEQILDLSLSLAYSSFRPASPVLLDTHMVQRLLAALLVFAFIMCAQRRADPQFSYARVIAAVSLTGSDVTGREARLTINLI